MRKDRHPSLPPSAPNATHALPMPTLLPALSTPPPSPALLSPPLPPPPPAATLVSDGKATSIIALPLEPDPSETLAAKTLIEHVAKISGATLEIATVNEPQVEA